MPRKLKGEVEAPAAAVVEPPVATAERKAPLNDAMTPGDRGVVKKTGVQYPAYAGRGSLPPPIKDGKGNIVKPGESRYFVNNTRGGGELIRIYRKRGGVGRSLVRMIKDLTPGKVGDDAKKFRARLRDMGVPGA